MSKGLKLTLLMVAVAMMGNFAMAEAPVVDEIPTVIVGGGTAASTPPNVFVYPDALDLSSYVEDDGGDAGIVWSFDVVGTAIYNFNGVEPLAGADPITPGALAINTQVLNSEVDDDSDADTVTIRNVNLSPFSGTGATPDAPGALFDSQVVTLWASDGATATQTEVMIWTENDGPDRLSTGIPEPDIILDFTTSTYGYNTVQLNATVSQNSTSGICVEVGTTGENLGWWSSDYGFADLQDNSVYQIRMSVSSNVTTAGQGPLWDVIVDNYSDAAASGANAYYFDALFLDNEGAANLPSASGSSLGRNDFEIWFAPGAVQTAAWRDATTGAFASANDADNDMRFIFRVLDGDSGGYGAESDAGQICLSGLTVTRYNIDNAVVGDTLFSNSDLTAANTSAADAIPAGGAFVATAYTFNGGNLTMGPSGSDWNTQIAAVAPGDGDFGDLTDDYPLTWESDQLYMLELNLSAPTATDAANPPDVIQFGIDAATNELILLNGVTGGGLGLNKLGTPQVAEATFVSFFYTHSASLTTAPGYDRLRPRVQVINVPALSFEGQSGNTGDITMHSWSVKKVTF